MGAERRYRPRWASTHCRPLPWQTPIIACRKVLRSFSGAETAVSEDDEAAGLSPGNEENEPGCYFSPEKPCLPLSTESIPSGEGNVYRENVKSPVAGAAPFCGVFQSKEPRFSTVSVEKRGSFTLSQQHSTPWGVCVIRSTPLAVTRKLSQAAAERALRYGGGVNGKEHILFQRQSLVGGECGALHHVQSLTVGKHPSLGAIAPGSRAGRILCVVGLVLSVFTL